MTFETGNSNRRAAPEGDARRSRPGSCQPDSNPTRSNRGRAPGEEGTAQPVQYEYRNFAIQGGEK